jgi:hypothetical protein
MRVQANAVLVDQIKTYIGLVRREIEKPPEIPEDQRSASARMALIASMARLMTRIDHLEAEQRALLLEVSCNTKIATSQLQIVSAVEAQYLVSHLTIPIRYTAS